MAPFFYLPLPIRHRSFQLAMHSSLFSSPAYRFDQIDTEMIDLPDDLDPIICDQAEGSTLVDTLRRFGFVQPLPVWQKTNSRYQLLAGYPYLAAIRSLAVSRVPCQILPPHTAAITRFLLQIQHGLSAVLSSPVLQAHLLHQAQQTVGEEEVLSLLVAMGHKPHTYKLKELIALLHLEPSVLLALHRGLLSLKTGKQLALLSKEDQRNLIELIQTYHPGGSKQQKLVELVTELSLRHNRPVRDIIQPWLTGHQGLDSNNIPQHLHRLLHALQEQHAPGKTGAEKTFQRLIHELQPPARISIEHSPGFEDDSLEVRLRFPDAASLKQHWRAITDVVTKH